MKCSRCAGEVANGVCISCGFDAAQETGSFALESNVGEHDLEFTAEGLQVGEAGLLVLRGPQVGQLWKLDGEQISIGRGAETELFLDDVTVSRKHAVLTHANGFWSIEDCGSLNGTYVGHEAIVSPTKLENGVELQIGKFKFRFLIGGAV